MRWILGILLLALFGVQSTIIVWQRAILSSATERRVEGDAAVVSSQRKLAELEQALIAAAAARAASERDGQSRLAEWREERDGLSDRLRRTEQQVEASRAESQRAADALTLAEKDLTEQREVAGKLEQELSVVRAELLWQKVRGAADGAVDGGDRGQARAQKQSEKQSQKLPPPVVTAHSAIAAETPVPRSVTVDTATRTDGAAVSGEKPDSVAASAAQPKKVVRREARRIRKDAPAGEPLFSFLP